MRPARRSSSVRRRSHRIVSRTNASGRPSPSRSGHARRRDGARHRIAARIVVQRLGTGGLPAMTAGASTTRILSHAAQASDLLHQLAVSLKQVQPASRSTWRTPCAAPSVCPPASARTWRSRRGSTGRKACRSHRMTSIGCSALVVAGRDLLPIGGALAIETLRGAERDRSDPATDCGRARICAGGGVGGGVQPAQRTTALDASRRCGGHLRVDEVESQLVLRVYHAMGRNGGTCGVGRGRQRRATFTSCRVVGVAQRQSTGLWLRTLGVRFPSLTPLRSSAFRHPSPACSLRS